MDPPAPFDSLRGGDVGSPLSRTAQDRSSFTNALNMASQTVADEERRLVAQVVSSAQKLPALRAERFSTERAVAQFLLEALFNSSGQYGAVCQDAAKELVSQGHIRFEASFQEQTPAQAPQTSTIECSNAVAQVQAQPPPPNAPGSRPVIKVEDPEDGPLDLDNGNPPHQHQCASLTFVDAVKKLWVQKVVSKYEELGFSAPARHFPDRSEAHIHVRNAMIGKLHLPVFKYHDGWTAFSILCRGAFEELVLNRHITFPIVPVEQTRQPAKPVSKPSQKKKAFTAKDKPSKEADKLADEWMERLLNSVTSQPPLPSPRTFFDRDAALNFLVQSVRARFQLPSLDKKTEQRWATLCQAALDTLKAQGHIDFPTRREERASRRVKKAAIGHECSPDDTKWVEAYKSGWNEGHQRGRSEGYQAGRADAYAEAMQQLLQKRPVHGQYEQGTGHARIAAAPVPSQQIGNGTLGAQHQSEAIKLASGPFIAGVGSRQSTGAKIFNDLANTNRYRSPALESLSTHRESLSPSRPQRRLEPPYPNHAVRNAIGFTPINSGQAPFGHPSPSRFVQTPRGLSVLASGAEQGAFERPDSTSRKRAWTEIDGGTQASQEMQRKFLR
ncbi:uncharacterized protein J3D65DRAFT_605403 [Phyllosticta citribraziliensis]|uniref:Uncharacterized protein n=1 Tax=Phyllosticta citribraziliensis TaxID=989973 RepID=A0ABR1LGG7_9PEZI